MGIFDTIESLGDSLASAFGVGQANAAEMPPAPPGGVMANAGPSFAPNSTFDAGWQNPQPMNTGELPVQQPQPLPPAGPIVANRYGNSEPPLNAPDLQPALKRLQLNTPGSSGDTFAGMPAPPPPTGAPIQVARAPGADAGTATPPPPPPASAFAADQAPPAMPPGGLAGSFGGRPPYPMPDYPAPPTGKAKAIGAALAGLGKGLSSLGNLRPGATGAQAFAAGAGGALEGGYAATQQQEQQERQRWNDIFNAKSAAFKDWIAGEKLGDEHMIAEARQRFLDATAAMRAAGGSRGNTMDSWRNTDWYKSQRIESILNPRYRAELAGITADSKQFGWDEEKTKAERKALEQKYDALREQWAKNWGIDPNTHKTGTSPETAFDAEKLTDKQLKEMPEHMFYKYRDPKTGKTIIRQRDYDEKPPFPGWQRRPPGTMPSPYTVQMEEDYGAA